MINGLQGIPGSGKSYEACVFQVLAALKEGRKVITNLPVVVEAYAAIDPSYRALIELRYGPAPVRGVWNAEAVDPESGQGQAFKLFDDGHSEPAPEGAKRFGTVWCYWSDWKHPKSGRGPLFVVDECHVAMPKIGTDKHVIEWYKLHRHFNCDVVLATQNFRQMSQDIAELMAMVVKVRKADILGEPDQYIRKVHAGYRGAVIQDGKRKYEPHFFSLYKSHTQGNSVLESGATDVAPFVVKFKRMTWLFWLVAIPFAVYAFWPSSPKAKPAPKMPPEIQARLDRAYEDYKSNPPPWPQPGEQKPASVAPVPAAAASGPEVPEPYASKGIHLTGRIKMGKREVYTMAVSDSGRRISQVTSDELVQAGYRWEPLTDCAGTLRWGSSAKAITCDAPLVPEGSKTDPVVIAMPKGAAPAMSSPNTSL